MDENNQNPMEPMQPMEPMNAEQPVQDNTQGQYQQYQAPQPEQTQYQQYQVPQQNYQQPQYQQTQPQGGSGFGVAALVLGIIALLLCWIPYINIVCTILAFIFGIIGIVKKSGKGQAIAGLVLSILAAIPTVVVMMLLNVIYGALGWFGATLTNTTTTRNSSVWNSLGTIWNSVENELGNAGNELSNLGNRIGNELNTVSNALSNITSNNTTDPDTTTTAKVDSKPSSVASPAKIGEWTTASSYSDGKYVDTPIRINRILRGADAEAAIKASGANVTSKLTDGCEWCVIDYSVDMTPIKESYGSRNLSSMTLRLRGADGKILSYGGKTWILTGSNLLKTSSIKTETYNGQYLYQIPKGCTDYLVEVQSSSTATTAYIKGE